MSRWLTCLSIWMNEFSSTKGGFGEFHFIIGFEVETWNFETQRERDGAHGQQQFNAPVEFTASAGSEQSRNSRKLRREVSNHFATQSVSWYISPRSWYWRYMHIIIITISDSYFVLWIIWLQPFFYLSTKANYVLCPSWPFYFLFFLLNFWMLRLLHIKNNNVTLVPGLPPSTQK